jgi:hypothetical protein
MQRPGRRLVILNGDTWIAVNNTNALLHLGLSENDMLVDNRVIFTENKLLAQRLRRGGASDNIEVAGTSLAKHLHEETEFLL